MSINTEPQRLVKKTERGWAGHFACANRCEFRRNTLVECGDIRIVISTVGRMAIRHTPGQFETVRDGVHFETMAFHAIYDGRYWDADVAQQVDFDSPSAISDVEAEDLANDMHESVVMELMNKMGSGFFDEH